MKCTQVMISISCLAVPSNAAGDDCGADCTWTQDAHMSLLQSQSPELDAFVADYPLALSEDVASKMWAGRDDLSRSAARDFMKQWFGAPTSTLKLLLEEGGYDSIQISGMFDSGTNLLGATLEANLGETTFDRLCPGVDQMGVRSSAQMHDGYHCFWWKHVAPPTLRSQLAAHSARGKKMLMLAMVRSPMSHISSMEKAPYDLGACVRQAPLLRDKQRRCTVPLGGGPYAGLVGVWNAYVEAYQNLSNEFPEHKVVVIEYERLVLYPDDVMGEIEHALGRESDGTVTIVSAPAKSHGNPNSRAQATEKIVDMTYLNSPPITAEVQTALCTRLDKALLDSHEFPISDQTRTYADDCHVSGDER